MHYLIDGHNLIARMPDISLDDPYDEVKLVLRLQSWAAARRHRRITVIFDGGLPGGKSLHFSNALVKVLFASVGYTADALLIKRIKKVKNPPEYTLISSDQEIIAEARARRMPYLLSEAFAAEMAEEKRDATVPVLAMPDAADDPQISEDEVAEWLELFGPVPETKPAKKKQAARMPKSAVTEPEQKKEKAPTDLKIAKRDDGKLSPDEVDEWLKLFDNRET
jgi:predicted RNA-binding protein with PIN domain